MTNKKIGGLIGLATRARKIVIGTDACIESIKKKKVKLMIVAIDSSERTRRNFRNICEQNNIPIIEILEIEELSKYIGKNNKAVIGIYDVNFSSEILKIVNGGENIG